MEFTVNTKLDLSGLDKIKEACKSLESRVIESGVLDADAETMHAAILNEFGGEATYREPPYSGEKVLVPPRSFVRAAAELNAPEAFKKATSILQKGLTEENAISAIESIGNDIEEAQRAALDNNGVGIPGWIPKNDPRTVAIKGFDRPLWSRRGETFPITHKVVKK